MDLIRPYRSVIPSVLGFLNMDRSGTDFAGKGGRGAI